MYKNILTKIFYFLMQSTLLHFVSHISSGIRAIILDLLNVHTFSLENIPCINSYRKDPFLKLEISDKFLFFKCLFECVFKLTIFFMV